MTVTEEDIQKAVDDRASVVLEVGEPEFGQSLGELVKQRIELAYRNGRADEASERSPTVLPKQ